MRPQTMGTSRPPVALGVYESVSSSNGASLPESSLLNAHGPLLHRAVSSQCSQISSPFFSSEITSGGECIATRSYPCRAFTALY